MWCGFKCFGPVPLSGLNLSKLTATGGEKAFGPEWDDGHAFEGDSRLVVALQRVEHLAADLPMPVWRIGFENLLRIETLQGLLRLSDRGE